MASRIRTKPRKEASQERSKATVDAILRATARILVKEGYDRASTNKIARAAGVSIGSLYQYFPSKEALVAALTEQHVDQMASVLRAAYPRLASAPLREAIEETVRLMVVAHALDPKLHKVLVEQVPRFGMLERVEAIEHEMNALLKHALRARQHEIAVVDLELAAFVVVGIVESLTHVAVLTRPELLGEAFVREVTDAVYRYLKG